MNRDRDYHTKRREYAEMGILIDPEEQKVVLCFLGGQSYQLAKWERQSLIPSKLLPQLVLTAEQTFNL
ncbi:MAG: hypothetical protein ACK4K5_08965 [Thermosynechococcus sp.]|uniref:hypothetical protein n=1 Tax=Thermosynechococcus sp. TaxID=2814275 RepID=UPI00391BD1CE